MGWSGRERKFVREKERGGGGGEREGEREGERGPLAMLLGFKLNTTG